jgi:hypothetical protein
MTTHGADFHAIVGNLKTLPPDQPNRIIAAGSQRLIHWKVTG